MFVTVIHKGTNKKSFIYSAVSLTNKFQQNLMNVPNYYIHSTYQNRKKIIIIKYINKYNKIKKKIIRRYENKKYKNIQKSIMLRGNLAI